MTSPRRVPIFDGHNDMLLCVGLEAGSFEFPIKIRHIVRPHAAKYYGANLAREDPLFFKPVHSQVAIVRQSLADVRLAPESTDQIVRGREPAEVGHSLQVPDDEAWLHAGRSVAQCLGVEKDVLFCFAT